MAKIARYLERLIALARPRRITAPTVAADADGLRIDSETVTWSDIRSVHAMKRDIYIGDFLCLMIFTLSGRAFEINEESPGWKQAGNAMEQFLPGALPHAEWTLRLLAANPGTSLTIYPAPEAE